MRVSFVQSNARARLSLAQLPELAHNSLQILICQRNLTLAHFVRKFLIFTYFCWYSYFYCFCNLIKIVLFLMNDKDISTFCQSLEIVLDQFLLLLRDVLFIGNCFLYNQLLRKCRFKFLLLEFAFFLDVNLEVNGLYPYV